MTMGLGGQGSLHTLNPIPYYLNNFALDKTYFMSGNFWELDNHFYMDLLKPLLSFTT